MEQIKEILITILHLIGSATPLTILCYMIVFILRGKKVRKKTVMSYLVVAVLMFLILFRT